MLGRLPKIRRRRSDAVPAAPGEPSPFPGAPLAPGAPAGGDPGAHAPTAPAGGPPAVPAGAEQSTAVLPVVGDHGPDQGGAAAVPVSPGFRDRGKLRRRLRYLRRVRELGYRDLGGLTFDLHRFGRDGTPLVQEKLAALGAVDAELRAVERALGEERAFVDLREAGIAACPRCAALHGSEARFCPSCGIALVGPMAGVASAPPAGTAEPPVPPAPLWGPPGPPAAHAPQGAGAAATPAPAAVFPGPVSPVPPEQPTQIVPAGAEPPANAERAVPPPAEHRASADPAAPAGHRAHAEPAALAEHRARAEEAAPTEHRASVEEAVTGEQGVSAEQPVAAEDRASGVPADDHAPSPAAASVAAPDSARPRA